MSLLELSWDYFACHANLALEVPEKGQDFDVAQ